MPARIPLNRPPSRADNRGVNEHPFRHFWLAHAHLRRALLLAVLVVAGGTFGYMYLEGWGAWDAFYFTLVTITTVGYGDYGISGAGERLAIVLMLGGIGVITYSLSQVMQATIALSLNTERKMYLQIDRLRDHVIVCGLGRIGRIVCRELARADIPFVIIETSEALVDEAVECGWLAVKADATEDQTLIRCGIEKASTIVCAVSSDNVNIVTTLTARDLCPKIKIISRADSPGTVRKIQRAGATEVISPIMVGAQRIADELVHPGFAAEMESGDLSLAPMRLREFVVEGGSSIAGRTVLEIGGEHPSVVFVAVRPAGGASRARPGSTCTIGAGDEVVVAGDIESLERFFGTLPETIAA